MPDDAAPGALGEADPARPGAGEVTASVVVDAPVERVFAAFVAWDRQGEWIPLTRVRLVEGDGGPGSLVEAVTALGPAVLRDQIRVERVDPPYEVRVVHTGPVLRGPGVLRCTPLRGDRTHIVWHEWFQLPAGLAGQVLRPMLWPGSKAGFTLALRRFARLVETGVLP
jgi:uncharacterized protein YndB with AHSA1/START domain